MPLASPDTTAHAGLGQGAAERAAVSRPACVALRVPTTPARRPSSAAEIAADEQHGRRLRIEAQRRREGVVAAP